jgi:hypothetical protein
MYGVAGNKQSDFVIIGRYEIYILVLRMLKYQDILITIFDTVQP